MTKSREGKESLGRKLLDAAQKGQTKTVLALIKAGADVDAESEECKTALMLEAVK
jgi:ankyrin repeat protein